MRLIAVPLARSRPGINPISTFVAQRAANAVHRATTTATGTTTTTTTTTTDGSDPQRKAPLSKRLLQRASAFWIDLGRTDQKSTLDWKRRTYVTGERLMDRIEYQEWALKGIDPAMDPKLIAAQAAVDGGQGSEKSAVDAGASPQIPLLYPPSLLKPEPLIASLKNLTDQRTPHHYKRFWVCVVGMPFTIPFALIPVVPNLPFFYLVYRAWSHWQAYKSSAFLSGLIAQNRLVAQQSPELDSIYAEAAPPPAEPAASSREEGKKASESRPSDDDERMLLKRHHIELLMGRLELPESCKADLRRARLQVERSMLDGKLEELESNSAGLK
ncbi:uncharacterized protein PFL1_06298 [Pseudozyma flocculosa PF-1]|uniref:Uncharacterized protein n=2 Tax=Pseudozyma flocculosa TaxID=84751 RepID=A0A5C3F9L7_9BASI|nr:uncharacterized protein PFL1_06298 [Pseudozyma flocculosa PF-1]EPQ26090.1 hypothetical protein PFL1_06298 [Pseudozyma flocculosa PF-1]SPO40335.1 uncharacterized protein PSFLO_05817 [Pseudozyma flocculosa]